MMKKSMIALAAGCLMAVHPFAAQAETITAGMSAAAEAGETAGTREYCNEWEYQAEENAWYYHGRDGGLLYGRQKINGQTYFFDDTGKMLTGWISSGESIGDDAEPCRSGVDDSVYYCDTTGIMYQNQWLCSYAPDSPYYDPFFSGPSEENDEDVNWYCFDAKGNAYRNKRLTWEGEEYLFDEDGVRLTGWVYEDPRSGSVEYVPVTDETSDAWSGDLNNNGSYAENDYAHNPQNYMFCDWGSGKLVKNCWITANPPGKDDDEDDRSYYCSSNGHIVAQYRYGFWRSSDDWSHDPEELNRAIVADKVYPRKVEDKNIGTYAFNGAPGSDEYDSGFEGFIFKADNDRYYICENNGAQLDGLMLVRKKDESTLRRFPNGFYDFSDHGAMAYGPRTRTNEDSGEIFYYYFADKTSGDDYRGRGVTGVYDGKLYYQGLAVASETTERYGLIYIPEIANRSTDATGMFLIDAEGNVKTGSSSRINQKGQETGGKKYTDYGGFVYRVCKPERGDGKDGYLIFLIDKEEEKVKTDKGDAFYDPNYDTSGQLLGADDAEYLYLKEAEE